KVSRGRSGGASRKIKSKPPVPAQQARLVRETAPLIESKAGLAGLVFYRHLFTLAPSLRPLFDTRIELQGRKVMEALRYTMASLESPKALVPMLEALGRRHVAYGARAEHYDTVVEALLLAMRDVHGAGFTTEVEQAWRTALGWVAEVMKQGADRTPV